MLDFYFREKVRVVARERARLKVREERRTTETYPRLFSCIMCIYIYISIYIYLRALASQSLSRASRYKYSIFYFRFHLYSSLLFITGCTNGCICAMYIIAHIIHMHVTAVIESTCFRWFAPRMPVALMYAAHAPSRTTNANVVPQNPILLFLSLSLSYKGPPANLPRDEKTQRSLSLCVVVVVVVVSKDEKSREKKVVVVFFGTTTTTTASKQSIDRPFLLGLVSKEQHSAKCVCVCYVSNFFLLSILLPPKSIYFISERVLTRTLKELLPKKGEK